MSAIRIAEISAEETFPLRSRVLRNRDSSIPCPFDGDTDATTRHFACFREKEIVAIASFYLRKCELLEGATMVQLRGMAVHPDYAGKGYGRELMHYAIGFYRDQGIDLIWCNARETAFEFYRKMGFKSIGEHFLIPDIGVHAVMYFGLE